MRPLTPADAEQLAHVAADADGAPLSDEARAWLASAPEALRLDGDRLVVVGIARTRYYAAHQVRAAVEDGMRVAGVMAGARDARPVAALIPGYAPGRVGG